MVVLLMLLAVVAALPEKGGRRSMLRVGVLLLLGCAVQASLSARHSGAGAAWVALTREASRWDAFTAGLNWHDTVQLAGVACLAAAAVLAPRGPTVPPWAVAVLTASAIAVPVLVVAGLVSAAGEGPASLPEVAGAVLLPGLAGAAALAAAAIAARRRLVIAAGALLAAIPFLVQAQSAAVTRIPVDFASASAMPLLSAVLSMGPAYGGILWAAGALAAALAVGLVLIAAGVTGMP